MWGAVGFGLASLIAGFVYDAGSGGYGGVMVVFVTVTVAALVTAAGVTVGSVQAGDHQETGGKTYVNAGVPAACLAVSVRAFEISKRCSRVRL